MKKLDIQTQEINDKLYIDALKISKEQFKILNEKLITLEGYNKLEIFCLMSIVCENFLENMGKIILGMAEKENRSEVSEIFTERMTYVLKNIEEL